MPTLSSNKANNSRENQSFFIVKRDNCKLSTLKLSFNNIIGRIIGLYQTVSFIPISGLDLTLFPLL